jgi:hypothetical protein
MNKTEKLLTRKELMQKLELLKPFKDKEQRNEIVCALIGHSRIIETWFGYQDCSRCGERLADALGGVGLGGDYVVVGHNCKICRKNYKKLDWRNRIYCPNPFKKR